MHQCFVYMKTMLPFTAADAVVLLCNLDFMVKESVLAVSQSSPSVAAERTRPCTPPVPAAQQQQCGGTPPRSISYDNVFI